MRDTAASFDKPQQGGFGGPKCNEAFQAPEVMSDRVPDFANTVGHKNGVTGVGCGFGTFAGRVQVDSKIISTKLTSLAEGGAMMPGQLWGKAA